MRVGQKISVRRSQKDEEMSRVDDDSTATFDSLNDLESKKKRARVRYFRNLPIGKHTHITHSI